MRNNVKQYLDDKLVWLIYNIHRSYSDISAYNRRIYVVVVIKRYSNSPLMLLLL